MNYRYRDFRASVYPYDHTTIYWNVLAARLGFIVVFEHLVFFVIYLLQWLVPDVPKTIQDKIDHERYIDQCERWANRTSEQQLSNVVTVSEAVVKMTKGRNESAKSITTTDDQSPAEQPNRKRSSRLRVLSEEKP
jgi:hypothetical protein